MNFYFLLRKKSLYILNTVLVIFIRKMSYFFFLFHSRDLGKREPVGLGSSQVKLTPMIAIEQHGNAAYHVTTSRPGTVKISEHVTKSSLHICQVLEYAVALKKAKRILLCCCSKSSYKGLPSPCVL